MKYHSDAKIIVQAAFKFHLNGNLKKAREYYLDALKINPGEFDALHMLGVIELEAGRIPKAKELLNKAIDIHPNHPGAINNAGLVALEENRLELAAQRFKHAIDIDPSFIQAKCNLALTWFKLKNYAESISILEATQLSGTLPAEAYNTLGMALIALHRPDDAIEALNLAVLHNNHYPEAYYNLGNAFSALKRPADALACYDKALECNKKFAEAWFNRGNSLRELCLFHEAIKSFEHAEILNHQIPGLLGLKIHTQMYFCEWSNFERDKARLMKGIENGSLICPPLALMSIMDDPRLQKKATEHWVKDYIAPPKISPIKSDYQKGRKIKLGYFSSDFHNHATMYLLSGVLRCHDRDSIDLFFFSFGGNHNDEMRQLVSAPAHNFYDISVISDADAADLARTIGIDIAIDLKGFTADCRPNIFAFRAAPIQISWLGFPGTMCCSFIDYIIADGTVIDSHSQLNYDEKLLKMPDCYQPNDNRRQISAILDSRNDHGLADDKFVFCCFNSPHKITPDCFSKWMRILHTTSDVNSVLWLLADSEVTRANLRKEASRRKIDAGRLVFAPSVGASEHLARLQHADTALDTSPYNSHTTGSDALWAGVPMVTECGSSFASRVGASLLKATQLNELICFNSDDYIELASRLAHDKPYLAEKKSILKNNKFLLPLFQTEKYTKEFELLLKRVYDRQRHA